MVLFAHVVSHASLAALIVASSIRGAAAVREHDALALHVVVQVSSAQDAQVALQIPGMWATPQAAHSEAGMPFGPAG
jgi:hypothetical protein